ncbi:MAG: arginase family protein [Zoogloeaceae bacterium]|jgi:hypothetical protein|nr:arginase family protein [Zoogloeaceae bacterium]
MSDDSLPVALDFDGSCRADGQDLWRIDLSDWQERVRFSCTPRVWRDVSAFLSSLPEKHGPVLLGSGDFHHISALLAARLARRYGKLRVLVCDNHPDNMRFPFGVHCGSWVAWLARLPQIARIDVVGICSADASLGRAWENCLEGLARGRVRYWTIGVKAGWTRIFARRGGAARMFPDAGSLVAALQEELAAETSPLYLSIDKDVLDARVARTNWDQGCFFPEHLQTVITAARPCLAGSDITGEVSLYRYRARWKRWLSALDGQPAVLPEELPDLQRTQAHINGRLLRELLR